MVSFLRLARRLAALSFLCIGLALAPWMLSQAQDAAPIPVTLRESTVFTLSRSEGPVPALARARAASRALAKVAADKRVEPARWELRAHGAVVLVGTTTIVALSPEDATAAGAPSIEEHAQQITTRVQSAVARERQRTSLANTVFAVSLVVFFGLITLYLFGRLRAFCDGAHAFLMRNAKRVPAMRLNKLEVLGPATVRNALIVLLGVARVLGVLGLGYTWLVVSLSLFESTRPLVHRLTGALLSPLSALVGRLALALPMFVVALVAFALIAILVRVAELFFASIERGETRIAWIPPELAHAVSVLVRGAIVVLSLLFAGPLLTGDSDGPLARGTLVLLACIALAATPLLASLLAGMAVVFSRFLRLGDRVEYGGTHGRILEVRLLCVVLEDEGHATVRVPHLRSLWHPTRVYPRELP